MSDWKQIAIELYRDGMPRARIRQKLECTAIELNSWLVDQSAPARFNRPDLGISRAKAAGIEMLKKGIPAAEVHKRLKRRGLKAALSTVRTWRWHVQGPVNQKIDQSIVREVIESMPGAMPSELRAVYKMRTGQCPSGQAISYWAKKLRAAA